VPGTFIDITVDAAVAADPELARKLAEVCPVDIFAAGVGGDPILRIVTENLDECVLCELCINAAPAGSVTVHKLYSGQTLPA
jgi:NAD-dependent dihydropyrimidine dehydrogenase PreA subunit